MILVLMGVSGSGKSTIGEMLAARLAWDFHDGDSFHSAEMKEKMRAGLALSDEDRLPWLERIADRIRRSVEAQQHLVIACSALRERYRDLLRNGFDDVRFVYLKGDYDCVRSRLATRSHEFMNPDLLASQFEALEEPGDALVVSIEDTPELMVKRIIAALGLVPSQSL
jgi:gluconokinase